MARIVHAGLREFFEEADSVETLEAQLLGQLADREALIFVAEDREVILGGGGIHPVQCAAEAGGKVCTLHRMYLAPHARGRGLGRRLLEFLLDAARRAGFDAVELDTTAPMTAARKLYRSVGFVNNVDCNTTPERPASAGCEVRLVHRLH